MRQKVRTAFSLGSVEVVGGGQGEIEGTCTNYQQIIRNIIVATQFVRETFHVEVRDAWMVEEVGVGAAMAELVQKMGFETLTIGRIAESEHKKRRDEKGLEFYWLPSFEAENGESVRGNSPGLFTHVMHEVKGEAPCGLGTGGKDFRVKRDAENYFLERLN